MPDLQRVVTVLPDGTYNHNVMRNAAVLLGAAIAARGLEHVTLDGNDPDFQRGLLRYAADPATAVYLGHRYYDMALIHADSTGPVRRNLFELLGRPVFAMLQDHPFSRFMWPRIQGASPTTHFVAPSPEFQAEAQFMNPGLHHFHRIAPMVTEAAVPAREMRPLAERSVDIFMSCGFNATTPSLEQLRARYAAENSPMTKVMDEVFETGVRARDRAMLPLFKDAFERHFGKALAVACPMTQEDLAVMLVLSCIDLRIRLERRREVVRGLARLDPALRIVITLEPEARGGSIAELAGRPNIELLGGIDAARSREIFLDAKFAVNVTPTYLTCVTERVSNAMTLGCCVISDKNRYLAETFPEGEEILFMDGCDAAPLARYFRDDLDRAQAIADRARQKALGAFVPDKAADDLIAVMRRAL